MRDNSKLNIKNSTLLIGEFVKWYRDFYAEKDKLI